MSADIYKEMETEELILRFHESMSRMEGDRSMGGNVFLSRYSDSKITRSILEKRLGRKTFENLIWHRRKIQDGKTKDSVLDWYFEWAEETPKDWGRS